MLKIRENVEKIIICIIELSIFVTLFLCLSTINSNDINNCIKAGNSKESCERNVL